MLFFNVIKIGQCPEDLFMRTFCVWFILSGFCVQTHAQDDALKLLESPVVEMIINGALDKNEWSDARELTLKNDTDHEVRVLIKYDREHLYVAFTNLTNSDGINHNAEILISTTIKITSWNANCYWFHSSYSNCAAVGLYYFWEDCTSEPVGWAANTFPFSNGNNNMEFRISFSKLNINPAKGRQIRMAFKVSNPLEEQAYWPGNAVISDPATWATVAF